jgi:hypothetical protein
MTYNNNNVSTVNQINTGTMTYNNNNVNATTSNNTNNNNNSEDEIQVIETKTALINDNNKRMALLIATGLYTGSYTDGIILDYDSGNSNARISAGSGDGFTFYNNANGTRAALMALSSSGVITTATWQGNTVTVPYGGTGLTTATTNGIVYGNGASAMGVTAAAGTADATTSYQILTVTSGGVPVWTSSIDGGTY